LAIGPYPSRSAVSPGARETGKADDVGLARADAGFAGVGRFDQLERMSRPKS